MNRLKAFLKKLRLRLVLTVLFSGILLFVTQACVGTQTAVNPEQEVPIGAVTNGNKEGINQASDADASELVKTAPDTKAEILKENAEQNIIEETSDVAENTSGILDKKAENIEEDSNNFQSSAKEAIEQAKDTVEEVAAQT
jgi:hypothetical protein